jgi:factor associated with neutral sphingomyelinase activation
MFLPPWVPFWERRNSDRGRFNLLLLEYGEIYVEDLAVFYYPVLPNLNHGTNFEQCEALKQKGRLKVCSRSLVFEPSDERQPLYKFAFKALESAVEPFTLRPEEADACRAASGKLPAGFVTFRCSSYAAMKENNRVGPYKAVDCAAASARFLFAVVHADVPTLLKKIAQLRSAAGPAAAAAAAAVPTPFNSSHLLDFHETLQLPEAVAASRVSPLLLHPGVLMVTDRRIYFQPSQLNNVGDTVLSVDIAAITHVYARRHLLRQRAIEVFFRDSRGPGSDTTGSIGSGSGSKKTGSVGISSTNGVVAAGPAVRGGSGGVAYFVFESEEARDRVLRTVAAQPCFPRSLRDLLAGSAPRAAALEDVFRRWQRREVSNFDYLMFLNVEADRSLLDLAQYPVMPHVLVDFSSDELDLADPAVFRDLSKPVGALTPQRLAFFRERYAALTAAAAPDPTTSSSSSSRTSSNKCSGSGEDPAPPPPFLYGTHYSTPGYVLYFLVRVAPEHMLCLSDGRFDAADRMFYSLPAMLDSCLHNPADLKVIHRPRRRCCPVPVPPRCSSLTPFLPKKPPGTDT